MKGSPPTSTINAVNELLLNEQQEQSATTNNTNTTTTKPPLIINIMDRVKESDDQFFDSSSPNTLSPSPSPSPSSDLLPSSSPSTTTTTNKSSLNKSSNKSSTNNTSTSTNSSSPVNYEAIERMASQRNQRKSNDRNNNSKHHQQRVEPIQSELLENDWLLSGYAEKQGRRSTMEDALVCELLFRQHPYAQLDNKYESFIGIYDGHGGSNTSKLVSEQLHLLFKEKLNLYEQFLEIKKLLIEYDEFNTLNGNTNINDGNTIIEHLNLENYYGLLNEHEVNELSSLCLNELIQLALLKSNQLLLKLREHFKFKELEQSNIKFNHSSHSHHHTDSNSDGNGNNSYINEESMDDIDIHHLSKREVIPLLIRETFLQVNEMVCKRSDIRDGSTASIIYIPYINEKIAYIGNVGDSRIVLCRSGEPIRLTVDHRPSEIDERRRVKDAGGTIVGNRVNACLAITRALGDKSLHPYIVSDASTMVLDLQYDRDEFIIVACDGLWDYVSDEKVIQCVRYENDPVKASIMLRNLAYDSGSTDNISVIVIRFKSNMLQEYN